MAEEHSKELEKFQLIKEEEEIIGQYQPGDDSDTHETLAHSNHATFLSRSPLSGAFDRLSRRGPSSSLPANSASLSHSLSTLLLLLCGGSDRRLLQRLLLQFPSLSATLLQFHLNFNCFKEL